MEILHSAIAILAAILLIIRFKIDPVISLLLACIYLGLATGQGSEGYASRNGTRPSMAQRHRPVKRYERAGFRPDRAAMWAVLLGVVLLLAAVTSAHAAVLAAHHALALR